MISSPHLQSFRFASVVDNSGIDDKIVGITKSNSNTISNPNANVRQPKELVLKFTSISAINGANTNTTNIGMKKSINRISSSTLPSFEYNLKFQLNNR